MSNELKDYVAKGLMSGALNSLSALLFFQGSSMINFKVPMIGSFQVPDAVVLAVSGTVGQVGSDLAHDYVYNTVSMSDKMRSTNTALTSLAVYNIAQAPFLYMSSMPLSNWPQYALLSSLCHYASESVYHDVISKRTGGILI